jgi:hypothetical protein
VQSPAFIEIVRDIVRQLKANPDVIPIATVPAVKRTMEKVSLNLFVAAFRFIFSLPTTCTI